MTLDEIHADEALRRREFPVTARRIYLAHGGVAPLPRRVTDAMAAMAAAGSENDQESAVRPGWVHETRELAARLIGARADEIAWVGPTSLALSFVAGGLSFRPGDNIVVCQDDYPSNVYPWMALAGKGVEVRCFLPRRPGQIELSDIFRQVDERTRLVSLSTAHFVTGWRPDVEAIGRWLRPRGVLFCLDAIQTLGAFPTSVEHVDFLAADAHKWLLGPAGAGLLYVRREAMPQLRPAAYGWHNVRCPDFLVQEELRLREDARRYEAGTHNLVGLAGLRAALELACEVGVEAIAATLLRHRTRLMAAMVERGWEVLGADVPENRTIGSVCCSLPGVDLRRLHGRLEEQGVAVSLRMTRDRRPWIRLTPHYYTTRTELDTALERMAVAAGGDL